MPSPYTRGDAVRIHRPGRIGHGHVGRFLAESPVQGHAEVCFTKGAPKEVPELAHLHRQDKCPRKIIPYSQLERYES